MEDNRRDISRQIEKKRPIGCALAEEARKVRGDRAEARFERRSAALEGDRNGKPVERDATSEKHGISGLSEVRTRRAVLQ
jgi:hypothetical protein